MILSLIGMSNIGKSHWSSQLATSGFVRFDCDALIAERWQGATFVEHDPASERQYLELEASVLQDVLDKAQQLETGQSAVIDCTGSVIYLPSSLQAKLKEASTVVYLETSKEHLAEMIERYHQFPKPLIWGTHSDYAQLLDWRAEQYSQLAKVTIPYSIHRSPATTLDQFLYAILQHQQS